MKHLEIRRHSIQGMGKALSQHGVDLARELGNKTLKFDVILTSPIQRACETAIAMGYAISEINPFLGFLPESLLAQISYTASYSDFAHFARTNSMAKTFGKTVEDFFTPVLSSLQDGQNALVISHAGMVEFLSVSMAKGHDFSSWGQSTKNLEGVRLAYSNDSSLKSVEFVKP